MFAGSVSIQVVEYLYRCRWLDGFAVATCFISWATLIKLAKPPKKKRYRIRVAMTRLAHYLARACGGGRSELPVQKRGSG